MPEAVTGVLISSAEVEQLVSIIDLVERMARQRNHRLGPETAALRAKLTAARGVLDDADATTPRPRGISVLDRVYDPEEAMVDVEEAARLMGMTPNGVRAALRRGALEGSKHAGSWYIPRTAVLDRKPTT
ncbi:helix-turn-helix domain-containing protein [Rhodococcus rhodochrous]|uniref:helix-turn-helix domain-containing protein n=1 Tax=Rhodococcus rhodochrous TaxID=1829 RepID=UPI0011AE929F|nr:helix-turn-helix domain-containing protein [Rhodococcus rhodochrous]